MSNIKELSNQEKIKITIDKIEKLENKDFNVYFFVLDTKGNPSGSLEYIYQTALTLQKKGYKVTMLHQEKETSPNGPYGGNSFVGVGEWLGEEYANIPHKCIETENVEINSEDFLFIPEIFTNVMGSTKKLPCERVIILQNYQYLSEFMPVGVTPRDYRIRDVITTTSVQEGIVKSYFPNVNTHVVSPAINKMFRPATEPQKLVVNVIARNQSDVSKVMKPFYWKYPIYKWISFRDLRGLSQDAFSEALREAAITIWLDDETNFGYAALEAMRSDTILISKLPQTFSDWNLEKTESGDYVPTDACVWFDHIDRVPDILASVIRTYTLDKIPAEVYEKQHKLDDLYTPERQEAEIEKVYVNEIFGKRKKEFEIALSNLKNNTETE